MTSTTFTAPEPVSYDGPKLFLAGSIDMDKAENWQNRFIAAMADDDIAILNPRRTGWDATWEQDISNPAFKEQVDWEIDQQEAADVIAMYFDPVGKAPITLMELGLFASTGKLVVCCPSGYWRRGNVQIICDRYGIPLVDTFDELVEVTREKIKLRGTVTMPLDIDNDLLLQVALSAHENNITLNEQVKRLLIQAIARAEHENELT